MFAGGHGFVGEPWLKEVVAEYERDTNTKVPIELGYGEYFTVHFPPSPNEPATLNLKGLKITIKDKFLEQIKEKNDESKS